MNLAIIGATGNVGRKTIEVLEKSEIKIKNLFLVASKKSAGEKLKFNDKEIIIEQLENYDFSKAEITIFAAGSEIAKNWVPKASKNTIVIDNSKYFRMNDDVPLVVAEVNSEDLKKHKNIIANPNCSTIQLMLPLKPLHDKYKIKRVIVSTYQAVSGAGKASVDELFSQTKDYLSDKKIMSKNFTKQIAFNLIPHIDIFVDDGYTKEEWKMENETRKILDNEIGLSATCVRVPVKTSHSESVNIEFENDYELETVKQILSNAPGCKVIDEQKDGGYITPLEAEGNYSTFISRIRKDNSNKKAINIWVVSDNLLKGAALNTVQIAEYLIKNNKK
ncbi:MAG: aspartate-semialdehyde dehydrogenase [Candidatus Pelagibacter sp. TMED272]|nr:aspartate-semialdehyde dehydrogenase [Pelagibacteraceae bacterium]RPG93642.1 MAG: aspartate-semialdehyde dehydrogenase [Candidatus Pelagibacter sp. TMED272]|tara:strand:- start:37069 stop:38067 length:999 start_codon:yes stop_codon:yes gene_type:complete